MRSVPTFYNFITHTLNWLQMLNLVTQLKWFDVTLLLWFTSLTNTLVAFFSYKTRTPALRQSRAPRASRSRVSGISSSCRWSRIPGIVIDGSCGKYCVLSSCCAQYGALKKGRVNLSPHVVLSPSTLPLSMVSITSWLSKKAFTMFLLIMYMHMHTFIFYCWML